jgi:CheY-like chemotaxis protein
MTDSKISDNPYALVVDDSFPLRAAVKSILKRSGFLVFEADDGDAAFRLLEKSHSEVVLLFTDVQMPGDLDGFALARKVAECWPQIAIVVASGSIVPGPDCMPKKARFIAKPFSAELVQAHLLEILPDGQKPERLKKAKPL